MMEAFQLSRKTVSSEQEQVLDTTFETLISVDLSDDAR